jgi:hypothetical protein
MKINGYGSIGSSDSVKKRGAASTSTSAFSDMLAAAESDESSAPAQAMDISATGGLTNLLALQEVSDDETRRRKLMQKGAGLLDTLEQLRRQLLVGTLNPMVIKDLQHQISIQKQLVDDPRLNQIIEDIELRAAVELAKLEMAAPRFGA